MTITEVQVVPVKPNNGLVGFASLVLDNSLYLSSIGVYKKLDGSGYRITYPTKIVGRGSLNLYHPINKELGAELEKAIIKKTKELLGN